MVTGGKTLNMSRLKLIILVALFAVAIPAAALAQEPVLISAQEPLEGMGTAVIVDDVSLSDGITFAMTGVTPPAVGTAFEGWVKTGSTVKSTGIIPVAADGSIDYTFASDKQLVIPLNELNSSGQSGHGVLTVNADDPSMTDVTLSLGAGTLETELVHIHSGQCGANLGGVVHSLTKFAGGAGASMTTVDATLNSLRNGAFAVNTHQTGNAGTYTACGNIPTEKNALTFALEEQSNSVQSGWATLIANGAQTDVVLDISAGGVFETELVHIHSGQCGDNLGGVVHSLASFVGGSGGSVTTVNATLASLRNGAFAVNTHQTGNAGTYTACGNIPTEKNALTFALEEQSNSVQSGWATLIANGAQTDVVLDISAGGVFETELVHIHSGQCGDNLGGVVHSLASFVGGSGGSVTTVNATLASLRNGAFAVNSHRAGAAATYTTCGTIPAGDSYYSGENLIQNYDEIVITVEPIPDNDKKPSGVVAFSAGIPAGAMAHIRHLLSDWPAGTNVGILTNLQTQLGVALLHANLAKNQTTVAAKKQHLEHVINAIEGPGGANYGDIDGNGAIEDFGDGVGALKHADDRKHSGFAAGTVPDDLALAAHAALVDEYGMNAEDLAILARDQALSAVGSSSLSLIEIFLGPGGNSVITLLDSAKNGSVQGGAAAQAYVEAQLMATYTMVAGPGGAPKVVAPPQTVGEPAIPRLAQAAIMAALLLLAVGWLLVVRSQRASVRD
jgi:hypothetical protein